MSLVRSFLKLLLCGLRASIGTALAIPRNSVESDHGCTSRIYFDNAGDADVKIRDADVTETKLRQ